MTCMECGRRATGTRVADGGGREPARIDHEEPHGRTLAEVFAQEDTLPAREDCICGHAKRSHRGATNRGGCTVTIWTYKARGCPCSRFLNAESPKGRAVIAQREASAKREADLDDKIE